MTDNRPGMKDRPISYWMAAARMGFENDFHRILAEEPLSQTELARRTDTSQPYISKILGGEANNYQLSTMVKLARAIGASVQIRLVRAGREVVRVLDLETAKEFDDEHLASVVQKQEQSCSPLQSEETNVIPFPSKAEFDVGGAESADSSVDGFANG